MFQMKSIFKENQNTNAASFLEAATSPSAVHNHIFVWICLMKEFHWDIDLFQASSGVPYYWPSTVTSHPTSRCKVGWSLMTPDSTTETRALSQAVESLLNTWNVRDHLQKSGQGKQRNNLCNIPRTLGILTRMSSARAVGQKEGAVTALLVTGIYPSQYFSGLDIFYAAPHSSSLPALAVRGTGPFSSLPVLLTLLQHEVIWNYSLSKIAS